MGQQVMDSISTANSPAVTAVLNPALAETAVKPRGNGNGRGI